MVHSLAAFDETASVVHPHGDTASTGVAPLDAAIGGLYWGDSVVWELEEGGSFEPFVAAALRRRDQFSMVVLVTLQAPPDERRAAIPGVDVIDARPGSGIEEPGALLAAVREHVRRAPRALVVFDSLDAFSDRWGQTATQRFFVRACPLLFDLWAVTYWTLTPSRHPARLRQAVDATTQCVLVLAGDRLRIVKAEGRPPGVQGGVLDGAGTGMDVRPAPTAARLGSALRALRIQRHLSQGELARLAGVSASAISQAERGRRGLALQTLLDLTSRLGMTIDELLRGEVDVGYRLSRRTHHDAAARLLPMLDDPGAGLRAHLSCLAPGQSVRAPEPHDGVELVAVATGLVQVVLPTGRPILRQGETLLVEWSSVTGWSNVGDHEAILFLVLRHDAGARRPAAPVG